VSSSLGVLWGGRLSDNHALATDVSLGGCYVETVGRVGVGEPIALDMMLSPRTQVSLRGEVAHGQWPMGFGLRYVGLTDGERASISRLVAGGSGDDRHQRPGGQQ
jgi:hypothetical protein